MALSIEEQRILDEMERKLAADAPRLASRLAALGRRPGLRGFLRSPRTRALAVVLTLAVIVAVTLAMYAMMPFRAATERVSHAHATAAPSLTRPAAARTGAAHARRSPSRVGRPQAARRKGGQADGRPGNAVARSSPAGLARSTAVGLRR